VECGEVGVGVKEAVGVRVTVSVGDRLACLHRPKNARHSWSGMRGCRKAQPPGSADRPDAQTPARTQGYQKQRQDGQRNPGERPGRTALETACVCSASAAAVPVLHFGLLVGLLAGYLAGDLIRTRANQRGSSDGSLDFPKESPRTFQEELTGLPVAAGQAFQCPLHAFLGAGYLEFISSLLQVLCWHAGWAMAAG